MYSVNQAIILAGGLGTRLDTSNNPDKCKSLILHKDKPMIQYLLENLFASGFENVIIATWTHAFAQISQVVERLDFKEKVSVVIEDGGSLGFRGVVLNLSEKLDERFLVVCGHHPISKKHLEKMRDASSSVDIICSGYRKSRFSFGLDGSDVTETIFSNNELQKISANDDLPESDPLFIRNPYIISREFIQNTDFEKEDYFVSYIEKFSKQNNKKIDVVESDTPPEFDYDFELENTRIFLDSMS